jgi:hypothetical protein
MLFGGEQPYHKTYQLIVYARTPALVLGWIPFVSYVTAIWDIILLIIGTHKVYKFSTTKSILLYVVPYLVIFLLFFMLIILAMLIAPPQ